MSRLPREASPAGPAPWRRRLPHFTPVAELHKGEYLQGEMVRIDYAGQFSGAAGSTPGRGGGGGGGGAEREARWFTEDGVKKFMDGSGEVLTGKTAYKASNKAKGAAGGAGGGAREGAGGGARGGAGGAGAAAAARGGPFAAAARRF